METGQVRSILGTHFGRLHPNALPLVSSDPNQLVESWTLVEGMRQVAALKGEAALRHAAADYVALWARTFRTLVRQLRGRPERAVALFAEEFYPFLRGDRLAARVESAQPGRARLLIVADLPESYLAGLLEAFVRLSGSAVTVTTLGAGRFDLTYRVAPVDRLARAAQEMAVLRVPLVVAAALACLLGIAMAARDAGASGSPWAAMAALPLDRVAAVLVGGVAAQLGANAWHDLRHPHPAGPLRLLAPSRRQSLWQARIGYTVAAACGLTIAAAAPVVLIFAAAGLVVSFLFGHLRDRGWGPFLAGLTYGPLMTLGAYHAFHPWQPSFAAATELLLPSLALGFSAAALLHLDDLADRPLDEAGGKRTLAVRLPRQDQAVVFDALAVLAVLFAMTALLAPFRATLLALLPLALGGGLIIWVAGIAAIVHRHLDDPAGLGPGRVGAILLHAVLAAILTVAANLGWGSTLVFALLALGLAAALRTLQRSRRYDRSISHGAA